MVTLKTLLKASHNILGVNERNLSFSKKYNRGRARNISDDKYRAYKILKKHKIPTPRIIKVLRSERGVDKLKFENLPTSFVIKPAMGLGGSGNLLIYGKSKRNGHYIGVDGKKYSENYLRAFCKLILSEAYALKFVKQKDFVIIQERVKLDPTLKRISYKKGLPDIRVILYKTIPVMAMIRLPTKQSGGRANLAIGGIAAGIDLSTGITTNSATHTSMIEIHPDTNAPLRGFKLPMWREILKLSQKASEVVELEFAAVDVVLDIERGPMILELNARPGLSIQIANQEGLKGRLERLKGVKPKSLLHARRIGMNLFGGEVEESVTDITGMQVVGFLSVANFFGIENKQALKVKVKNDTGAMYTSIDRELAIDLGFKKTIEDFDALGFNKIYHSRQEALAHKKEMADFIKGHPEITSLSVTKSGNITTIRPRVKVQVEMEGVTVETTVNIANRNNMIYRAIIGRKTLRKNFLIDTNKLFNRYLG